MRDQEYHHPTPNEDNVQHSAGLALYLEQDWGRKSVSGCWDGKWKTMFWLDQVEGVAGVWFTNVEAISESVGGVCGRGRADETNLQATTMSSARRSMRGCRVEFPRSLS
jgi:hypothetical protein